MLPSSKDWQGDEPCVSSFWDLYFTPPNLLLMNEHILGTCSFINNLALTGIVKKRTVVRLRNHSSEWLTGTRTFYCLSISTKVNVLSASSLIQSGICVARQRGMDACTCGPSPERAPTDSWRWSFLLLWWLTLQELRGLQHAVPLRI